jgi:hypothetical protein
MPFGIQTKGLLVGALIGFFVIPWLWAMVGKKA